MPVARLPTARHHHPVSRPGGRHRQGGRRPCYDRHRGEEFLAFLKKVAKAYPDVELHVICDNLLGPQAHRCHQVAGAATQHPHHVHFTPTHSSWTNLIESFFSIITRQAIRRGSFTSVRDLTDAIRRFIDAWNQRCQPFVWTKTVDYILADTNRKANSETDH